MVYQRLPSSGKPNLNPEPRAQPQLYQPGDDSAPSTHHRTSNTSYKSYYLRRRLPASLTSSSASSSSSGAVDGPDPRLALVPPEWFNEKKVLDVGCNSGLVTIEIAQRLGASRVVGVDVDKELVKAAKGNADLAWSRQAPLKRLLDEAAYVSSSSRKRPRSNSPSQSRSRSSSPPPAPPPLPPSFPSDSPSPFTPFPPSFPSSYFPLSLPRQFGFLPRPSRAPGLLTRHVQVPEVETQGVLRRGKRKVMPREEKAFPENLRFRCADWVEDEEGTVQEDREGYDVIVAFSITKWIHLTSLNAGLLTFFRRCFTSLLPGGRLILEPQPFSSYSRTLSKLRHSSSSSSSSPYAELQSNLLKLESGAERGWRAEEGEFERVLLESVGFERRELLGWTGEEGSTWRRPVEVYTKRGGGSWGV
ncbi:hypothetical protein JCM8547_006604 [Rhodosporidiobolus lusitaniae]